MAKRKPLQAGASDPGPGASTANPADLLNPNQKKFCRYYVRHHNGTLAYHKAYPEAGYDTCRSSAADLLAKPSVSKYVALLEEKDRVACEFTRQDALRIFASIARGKYSKDRDKINAASELWEKLGLGEEAGKGSWFDGLEHITELVRGVKKP